MLQQAYLRMYQILHVTVQAWTCAQAQGQQLSIRTNWYQWVGVMRYISTGLIISYMAGAGIYFHHTTFPAKATTRRQRNYCAIIQYKSAGGGIHHHDHGTAQPPLWPLLWATQEMQQRMWGQQVAVCHICLYFLLCIYRMYYTSWSHNWGPFTSWIFPRHSPCIVFDLGLLLYKESTVDCAFTILSYCGLLLQMYNLKTLFITCTITSQSHDWWHFTFTHDSIDTGYDSFCFSYDSHVVVS